jgi:PAS domain S-box-containing protein
MHSLLARQLKNIFGSTDDIMPEWQGFLKNVDDAYHQSDADRLMLERALDLSSEELMQANSEMRALFQTLPDIFFLIDPVGKILDFKGPAAPDPNFTEARPFGKTLPDILSPELHAPFLDLLAKAHSTRSMASIVYNVNLNDKIHYYEARCVPFLKDQAVIVIRNITERKQAEERLQKEVLEKSIILDTMSEIVVYIDRDHNVVWANQAMHKAFNLSPETYHGRKCYEIHGRKDRCPFCPAIRAMETGEPQNHPDLESYGKRWVLRGYPVRNEGGEIIGAVEIVTDVTESRNAEDSLRQSEEKYKLLVENANMAITIAQDLLLKYVNPKTSDMVGYGNEELLGMPIANYIHPDDLDMFLVIHQKRLRGEEFPHSYTARVVNKNGDTLWCEFAGVAITWEGKPATLNFIKDVTQQKKLEEQLLQAQKLEAIGTLAGGVAHDFNNLLMGIQGYASLMLLDMDSSHPYFTKLKSIEQQVQSGANLTKQLLGFARGGKYEVKATNLNKFILFNSELFGRTKKEITIHKVFAEDLRAVEIDRGQIDQVFLNLYINAWQAMPGRGSLYLETQNVSLGEGDVQAYDIPPGRYVKVSIRDTGMGMDEPTRRRIFDPFFTTKEMGRGVGLGLASAYGIICNHGGIITVDSEKGKGTTFHIFLPATENRAEGDATPASVIHRGHETILIVDDEAINIEVIGAMAKKLGYQVVTADSGQEAAKQYRLNSTAIDLVILDAIMPGLSGSDTFEILKAINPRIKVILASGYSLNELTSRMMERGVRAFIQKPFRIEDIAATIKTVLTAKD